MTHEDGRPGSRVWLKIDVQGYEREVLAGSVGILDSVVAIEMEMSLLPLYDGAPLARELIDQLDDLGFQLVGVEEAGNDLNGLCLSADGIFANRALAAHLLSATPDR